VGAGKERKAELKVDKLLGGGKVDISTSKKSLKVVKSLRRLVPGRFRQQQQPVVFRSSMSTTQYQEMVEDEHEHDEEHEEKESHSGDSMTYISRRSTRNNVRTGRTMLVRQKAKVFSSPSTAAQAKCEISSSFSFESTDYRNILQRQRSLTLDNSSSD